MERGKSSLNPNAASYVPLFKQGIENKIEASKITGGDSKTKDKTALTRPSFENHRKATQNQFPEAGEAAHSFSIHHTEGGLISKDWTVKGQAIPSSHDSKSLSSVDITEKLNLDEESEVELTYLAVMFPGLSEQSLADVYAANGGDLEATTDMLTLLEFPVEVSQHLPDTLDIGGMVESKSPAEGTTVSLYKQIFGETSGSSSSDLESSQ